MGPTIAFLASAVVAVGACNGEVLELGGDTGRDGSSLDATTGADVASSSSSLSDGALDSSAGSSSGGGSGSGGGPTDTGVAVVPGNVFPCGSSVCTPPDVCCQTLVSGTDGGELPTPLPPTCEAPSACHDVALGCTITTCPSGSVCCGSISGFGGPTGSGQCQVGTTCSPGTGPFCTRLEQQCPPASYCAMQDLAGTIYLCMPTATFGG